MPDAPLPSDKPPSRIDRLAGKRYSGGRPKGRPSVSELLKDLRWVWRSADGKDDTPGQKVLRKMLKESPEKFVAQLSAAERLHKLGAGGKAAGGAAPDPDKPQPPAAVDEGSARAVELYQRLLAEFAAKEAKR